MKRRQPESAIQRAIVQHLKARGIPNLFWFATQGGGYRRKTEAAIMVGLGARPGLPDLILIHRQVYGLELKTPLGKLSQTQKNTHELMRKAGAVVETGYDIDDALRWLEGWGLLRGSVI